MNKIIFPLKSKAKGKEVSDLHQVLEFLKIAIPNNEKKDGIYGDETHNAVKKIQQDNQLKVTGEVNEMTAILLNKIMMEKMILITITGIVTSPFRAGVGNLNIKIVDKNLGGDKFIAQTRTDFDGSFSVVITIADIKKIGKIQPDLQAKAFINKQLLGESEVQYNFDGSNPTPFDIYLSQEASTALQSEHESLIANLFSYFKGNLRNLKENEKQQDITYLANKTGWDARAVAMAALADRFSQMARGIPSAAFYALFRSGLPADEERLYHTDAAMLKTIWNNAVQQGLISQNTINLIPNWIAKFTRLSNKKILKDPAHVGVSSFKEMLVSSHLDEDRQSKFTELYTTYRKNLPQFWKKVSEEFGPEVADQLQVDGKLGFLTINNAPLILKLHEVSKTKRYGDRIKDPVQLAEWGYHGTSKWEELFKKEVHIAVPDEIPGETKEEKNKNYASYLASMVRLSYPTASVAELIKSERLAGDFSEKVHAFLSKHQGTFQIGAQPIEQYIKKNKIKIAPEEEEPIRQIKRVQRIHQITPSDEAMACLLKDNVDAAYHIVRKQKKEFVRAYGKAMGGDDQAAITYERAVQVHNAVLNIMVSFLTASNAPGIGAHSDPQIIDPSPTPPANTEDVIAYSTLESLFGELDYCACDHCRSILSPAAYLVDLLQFIDTTSSEVGKENPQVVLLQRRPDIQYLPLTCENTNTALPYIDIVNEILEYYVWNQVKNNKLSLEGYEGHDTKGVTSEDLLACPQNVNNIAYDTLRDARFPDQLPFHQPLEYLRRYFDKFNVPLTKALESLRKSEDLERPNPVDPSSPVEYGWRDILLEEICMSRVDNEIITTANAAPYVLWQIYGFPTNTHDQDIINGNAGANILALSNAKQYSRRLGITYEDIVTILRTRFVNPNSDLIPKLERLGVSFVDMKKLKDGNSAATDAVFDALLPTGPMAPDASKYGGDIKAWVKDNNYYSRIMNIITLMDSTAYWAANKGYNVGDLVKPSSASVSSSLFYYECTTSGISGGVEPGDWPNAFGNTNNDGTVVWTCRQNSNECNFEILEFRHTDPASNSRLTAVEFVRMLRFIRLWKKTGWTVEQTDAAICSLFNEDLSPIETDDIDDLAKLNTGFLRLIPRLGIILRIMKSLDLAPKKDLLPLLACFGHISTNNGMEWLVDKDGSRRPHIVPSLYRQMFLNPVILNQDSSFSDDYGTYLDGSELLSDHEETLRSAFKLTGDEFGLIIADLPLDANLIDRDQNNRPLLTLKNVSTIFRHGWLARVFKLSVRELLLLIKLSGFAPFGIADLTDPAIVRLIKLVQDMKVRNLKIESALYLIWNQDLSGKSVPSKETIGSFARTLRLNLDAVKGELAVKDDPDGSLAQARMALVYGDEVAAFFFGLLNDTFSVDVSFGDPDGTLTNPDLWQAIENASGKTDAGVPKLTYDGFRKLLSYSGVLSAQKQGLIKQTAGVGADKFKTAIDNLYTKSQEISSSFFQRFPELQTPYNVYVGSNDVLITKRNTLLSSIMPDLVRQRKCQKILQEVSAMSHTDLEMSTALLEKSSDGIALHAKGQPSKPAIEDFVNIEQEGISVKFYASDTANGNVIPASDVASNLDYSPLVNGIGNPLPSNPIPGAAISAIWKGFIEAPANGFYKILLEADRGSKVTINMDSHDISLSANDTLLTNDESIELRAGILYPIEIKVEKVKNIVRVQWEWTPNGQGRMVIPSQYLYPLTQYEAFRDVYLRFLRATSITDILGLSASEIKYFAINADYEINADKWLNALPVNGNAPYSNLLIKPLQALLDYSRLKADFALDDERLIDVFNDPVTASKDENSLLYMVTRWNVTSLDALLVHFGKVIGGTAKRSSLKDLNTFVRVHDAFILAVKMGLSGRAFIDATTNEPDGDIIQALQTALCARYDSASWRDLIHPISDHLRELQRDALVAYILHQMQSFPKSRHIDTPEKLFEYFLMDVQMEPCMLTSRIRHALSSVQLFIERSLMNLEKDVSPADINQKQWEWKRRYRIWEANRKVFLYPENWLEPELRDDKSPFFKEIESELLQGDITEDSAATAMLNYLSKLEEVAKLEPCGIYNDETNDVDHVIARTAGANRKYYYRRREGRTWTPWEQIKLDIEDNPVIPVVWRNRLLLFWLKILKQSPNEATTSSGGAKTGKTLNAGMDIGDTILPGSTLFDVQVVLNWSEYYHCKWQPTKTSDVRTAPSLGSFDAGGPLTFLRDKLQVSVCEEGDALKIDIYGQGDGAGFIIYNTHSLPIGKGGISRDTICVSDKYRFASYQKDSLTLIYGAGPDVPMYRMVNNSIGDHFYTISASERDNALSIYGYTYEGVACYAYSRQVEGVTPLYRLRNDGVGDHFYTTSAYEREMAIANSGYIYEGIACYVSGKLIAGSIPLYRLYNNGVGDHFYTTSPDERDNAVNTYGYTYEGEACYVYASIISGTVTRSRSIFNVYSPYKIIEPTNKQQMEWQAPFFYEDPRHVFYVKSKLESVFIGGYRGYGIPFITDSLLWSRVPRLMVKDIRVRKPRLTTWKEFISINPRPGFIDPVPMSKLISEDAFIHRGFEAMENIKYGDALIGPLGCNAIKNIIK